MHGRPKYLRFQFSLRALLVVVTLVSLPLGWVAYQQHLARKKRAAINRLHRLIRDAEVAIQPKAVGRPWSEVRESYLVAGHSWVSSDEMQHVTDHRFLIRPKAWLASDGTPHDLIVDTTVDRCDPKEVEGAQPDHVLSVEAGLVATPKILYAQAVKQRLYPEGSVMDLCLAQPEVIEAAAKYPILNEVKITYDLIRDRWSDCVPFGFHILVDLESKDGDAGQRLSFSVAGDLDPIQDWSGQRFPVEFSPSNELGDFRHWGGSEWRSTK